MIHYYKALNNEDDGVISLTGQRDPMEVTDWPYLGVK